MNTKFYIINNGVQEGPYTFDQLRTMPIERDTYMWAPGMDDWKKAGEIPQLASLFGMAEEEESAFGGYARPLEPEPYPYGGYNPSNTVIPHTNWMPFAICSLVLGALFSCIGMIFGIIGVVNASKANKYYGIGDEVNGKMANSTARTMTIIALSLASLGIILSLTGIPQQLVQQYLSNLPQ